MIGYNTIVDNKATLETMVDLYQKQCDMYRPDGRSGTW